MRLLAATLFLFASLVTVADAQVVPREIPGGNYPGIAVDGGFFYWTEESKTCGGCQRVGRTDIKSGLASIIGRLPSSRQIFTMRSGGGRTIVGTVNGSSRTAMFEFVAGQKPRKLMSAVWRSSAVGKCGSVAFPGAVSPQGEATWDVLTASSPGKKRRCNSGQFKNFSASTYIARPRGHAKLLAPVWRRSAARLQDGLSYLSFSRTFAINENFALLSRNASSAVLVNRKTGKQTIRPFVPRTARQNFAGVLAEDGSTIGARWVEKSDYAYTQAVLNRNGSSVVLKPTFGSGPSEAMFCGNRIVQLSGSYDEETGVRHFALVLRDARGEVLNSVVSPSDINIGEIMDAGCDANTLVIQSVIEDVDPTNGTGIGAGLSRVDGAKTWAIDLG
ncbi:MAG: hypothetical protein ACRDKE_12590 [Solirubrobacterales bacterium]